jgi:hypothetical protein
MILTESHQALPPHSSRQSQNQTAVLNICLSSLTLMMEAVAAVAAAAVGAAAEAAAGGFSDTPATLCRSTGGNTPQVFIPYYFSNLRSLVARSEVSALIIPKPTNGHEPRLLQYTSNPHSLLC